MRKPKRRKPNPRHRAAVREKRRARAFWRLREQCRQETEREFAPPSVPRWRGWDVVLAALGTVAAIGYVVAKIFS